MSSPHRTLPELVSAVAAAMAGWSVPDNGQVRALPDERTLRWYGTIGLLDRPLSWRGRTALYGERHLLQVLAIKRLQAAGWPIAAIQQRLLGADDAALRAIPMGEAPVPESTPAPEAPVRPRREGNFWAASPSQAVPGKTRLHLDLGHGAEVVLPQGLAGDGLEAALEPLRAWLAQRAAASPVNA